MTRRGHRLWIETAAGQVRAEVTATRSHGARAYVKWEQGGRWYGKWVETAHCRPATFVAG